MHPSLVNNTMKSSRCSGIIMGFLLVEKRDSNTSVILKMHFTLSINVFCTNVLIEDPIFTSLSTEQRERLAISSLLFFFLFQLFFKTLALGYWSDLWNRTPATSKRAPAIGKNVGCQSRNPLCITFFLVIVPAQTPTTFRCSSNNNRTSRY